MPRHGVSSSTFYKWKAKFGGMDVSKAYAQALTGQIGRPAALVDGCADRPLASPANHGSDHGPDP